MFRQFRTRVLMKKKSRNRQKDWRVKKKMMNYYPYQYQNPYTQPQVATSQPNLFGRLVNDFNEITVNDVPMNGNYAYFPKNDMSEIEIRRWSPNGTIEKHLLKLVESDTKVLQTEVDTSSIKELKALYESVNERLDKIEKTMRTSKKVSQDE